MKKKTEFKMSGNVLEVDVTNQLTKEDVEKLTPVTEQLIKDHGKIRLLFVMNDFQGWTEDALKEDINFDLKHFADIERIGIVGGKEYEHDKAIFCRPYSTAEKRHFDLAQIEQARKWISEKSS